VEDEDALRQPVARLLRSTGFSVLEASDGSAALDVIREHNTGIEFLLLDVTLPGASSHAVLEEATRLRPKMKVIVTSAYSKDAAAASLQANVVHFLRKPYKVGDLVDMVRRTI
jgi:DNA-binding NtrC family response regulator